MTVKITGNDKGTPPGKLAEAEVHFDDGYFQGLKLVGFAVWERRNGSGRARTRTPIALRWYSNRSAIGAPLRPAGRASRRASPPTCSPGSA